MVLLIIIGGKMKIKKISYIGKEKVYDIKNIQDNHNYIANNFIVHNCDEAVNFITGAEWNKKENKELKKKLAQIRTKHFLFILAFPLKIQRIETNYLNSFVNYWIHLSARGRGGIFVPDMNPANDQWRMKAFLKLGSYTEFTEPSKVDSILKKHPNFWTTIKFPKPPKWLYDSYLKVREKNVYDTEDVLNSVSNEDIVRALLILSLRDIVTNDSSLSMNRLMLHIKNKYDINLRKKMIFDTLEDSKQLVLKIQEKAVGITSKKDDIVIKEEEIDD